MNDQTGGFIMLGHRNLSSRRRAGFTLVEALVVTAIMAILFGLATGAVVRALHSAEDAKVGIEIRQLEAAVAAAKKHFGVEQLPSAMRLRKNNFYNLNDPLEKRTKDYLSQMFPRMPFATTNDGTMRVDWNATGATGANQDLNLGPAETLVFFLGGRNGTEGWSPNPLNPMTGAGTRVAPFYEFNPDRMSIGQSNFRVYRDPYNPGRPYLYFTSYRSGNDYSPLDVYTGSPEGVVSAFREPGPTGRFINPNSFQIVCAGRDGLFGNFPINAANPFILWRNGSFTTFPTNASAANDNLANFHPTKLSIPQ
jgi:prepilin-type N-terminal cleavage/methylation domain-containing protein